MRFLLRGHIWLGFCSGVMTMGYSHFVSIEQYFITGLWIAFCSVFVYNIQQPWLKYDRNYFLYYLILGISGMACLAGLWFLFAPQPSRLILPLSLFTLALWYQFPLGLNYKPLRQIPGLKIWILAITWTLSVAAIPLLLSPVPNMLLILLHLLYFFALSLLFDLRDIHRDASALKTLPHLLGLNYTRLLLVLVYLVYHIYFTWSFQSFYAQLFFQIHGFYFLLCISLNNGSKSNSWLSMLMDGGMILLGLSFFYA